MIIQSAKRSDLKEAVMNIHGITEAQIKDGTRTTAHIIYLIDRTIHEMNRHGIELVGTI